MWKGSTLTSILGKVLRKNPTGCVSFGSMLLHFVHLPKNWNPIFPLELNCPVTSDLGPRWIPEHFFGCLSFFCCIPRRVTPTLGELSRPANEGLRPSTTVPKKGRSLGEERDLTRRRYH